MNKLFRRVFAYIIDMMVILLIVQSLSGVPQINKQLDDYNKYYGECMDLYNTYLSFKLDLKADFKDKKLSDKEYDSLVEEHDSYKGILDKYYMDGNLTEENYDKLNTIIDDEYNEEYRKLYYRIEQNSIFYFIIYLVVVFGYFVGFNKYTKGQTLGKKLTRLKVVNSKDETVSVSIWSYVVRALVLYQPIYYMVKLIGIIFMDSNMYYNVTSFVYDLQGYLEMLIIAMITIRVDGRGPHDFLAKTRVILYDKNGQEVKDKFNTLINNKKDTFNENIKKSKKVIDEEPADE